MTPPRPCLHVTRPNRHGVELMHINNRISYGGKYLVNLDKEINSLAEGLKYLRLNTMVRRFFRPIHSLLILVQGRTAMAQEMLRECKFCGES
jgi:hypothetical protein